MISFFIKFVFIFSFAFLLSNCATKPDDPTVNYNADQLYIEARKFLDKSLFQQAIDTYSKLETRYPYGLYTQHAKLEKAYALWKFNNNLIEAISSIDRFLAEFPNHKLTDYALYLKGRIYFRDNLGISGLFGFEDLSDRDDSTMKESYNVFKELIEKYPDSNYSDDARKRMIFIYQKLAKKEYEIAGYYHSIGSYIASANRLKYILEHYPKYNDQVAVLQLLKENYTKLELDDLAKNIDEIINSNL